MNSQTTFTETAPRNSARAFKPSTPGRTQANAIPPRRPARSSASDSSRQEIVFRFDYGSANEVLLAGNFTEWESQAIQMRKNAEGSWQTKVSLKPGLYRYKFLVDGQWHDDPRAAKRCPNPFGTTDNVLEIP